MVELKVKFNGKTYIFDLEKELNITSSIVNKQIESNPSRYGLISLIKNEYIHKRDKAEIEKDKAYSRAYVSIRDSNPRVTHDHAAHKANLNPKFIILNEKYLKVKSKASDLIDICKALEMRSSLLQTISSNKRKEL